MGRNRIDLGAGSQAKIALMMQRGDGADRIAAELGVSLATAKRRMREIKGVVTEVKGETRRSRRAAVRAPRPEPVVMPSPVDVPSADGDDESVEIPEGSSLEQIDRWLKVAEREAEAAAGDDDPKHHINWVRLAAALIEARRKAAPLPKPDPNENPDMIEAAVRVRKRWHALADSLVRVSNSPLADMIGRLLRASSPDEDAAGAT